MRDGAAHQSEVDPRRPFEADRLESGGGAAFDLGEMGCEHEVAAALPNLQFVVERVWRPAEVGGGDHVEDDLGRRGDRPLEWSKRLQASADAQIERQRAARQEAVGASQRERGRATRERLTENSVQVLATIAVAFPGGEIQKRLQC